MLTLQVTFFILKTIYFSRPRFLTCSCSVLETDLKPVLFRSVEFANSLLGWVMDEKDFYLLGSSVQLKHKSIWNESTLEQLAQGNVGFLDELSSLLNNKQLVSYRLFHRKKMSFKLQKQRSTLHDLALFKLLHDYFQAIGQILYFKKFDC